MLRDVGVSQSASIESLLGNPESLCNPRISRRVPEDPPRMTEVGIWV